MNNQKKLRLCVISNLSILIFVFILAIFFKDNSKYWNIGPSKDLNIVSVKIDNSISGILYKTKDFKKIETFKDNLSNLIGNYAVVNMEGSMVTSVSVPMNCTAFNTKLGPLNMAVGNKQFNMSIWSFLTPSVDKKKCKFDI